MEIIIDLKEDWRNLIINDLISAGYQFDTSQNVEDITYQLYSTQRREITVSPRKIYKSNAFRCPTSLKKSLSIFESDLENGRNVNCYLSRNMKNLDYNDFLLNDWGIHHFHLSTEIDQDGFKKRSGLLLFAKVTHSAIYFINMLSHGNWTKKNIVNILNENWPDLINKNKLKGITSMTNKIDESIHEKLRKAGITTITELEDGTHIMEMGGGYASDGSSADARIKANNILSLLKKIENNVKEDINYFIQIALNDGVELIGPLQFKLEIEEGKIFVSEENKNVRFLMHE